MEKTEFVTKDNVHEATNLEKIRSLMANAERLREDKVVKRCKKRIFEIAGNEGETEIEIRLFQALAAYEEILKENTLTANYLNGNLEIEVPKNRRKWSTYIEIIGARENNLQNVDVRFPLEVLTVITGVSGSGKSTLVKKILFPAMQKKLEGIGEKAGQFTEMQGHYHKIRHIEVTQALKMTPIVAMTAHVLDEDRVLAKKAGMQDFLIKPVSADEFQRVLKQFL